MTVLRFSVNPAFGVEGTLVEGPTDADGALRLIVEFAPDDWETIDMLMLFHLGWDERHDGSVSGTRPVQVEMRLDPEVAAATGPLDGPDELAALADDHPARNQANWYALNVTEAVDLPPELAGAGDVRSGFSTVWSD